MKLMEIAVLKNQVTVLIKSDDSILVSFDNFVV